MPSSPPSPLGKRPTRTATAPRRLWGAPGVNEDNDRPRRWQVFIARSTLAGVIDELRAAVEALGRGDTGPFVALIDDDGEWRGVASGRLWWKHEPS